MWNGFGSGVAGASATEMEMTSGHMTEGMLVAFMMTKFMAAMANI